MRLSGSLGLQIPFMAVAMLLHVTAAAALTQSVDPVLLPEEIATSNVVLARGLLIRSGEDGTSWTLAAENAPKIRGETVLQVTFTTHPGSASRAYERYDGNTVELTGEVKSVDRGNVILRRVLTIGLVQFSSPASAIARRSGLSPNPSARNSGSAASATDRVPYRHAYYLFLASDAHGCEACYLPLIICQNSIEGIANSREAALCVFLITYERDSIWESKGAALIDAGAMQLPPRVLAVNGRSYRYQEISPREVLRILENPGGTIPISRPYVENKAVPGASPAELIADFRALECAIPPRAN